MEKGIQLKTSSVIIFYFSNISKQINACVLKIGLYAYCKIKGFLQKEILASKTFSNKNRNRYKYINKLI